MPYTLVDKEKNISVWYEDWGEGDKFIFQSQIYLDYYAGYARELSKRGYHVIAIQMRGYGKSSRVSMDDNPSDYSVSDILAVADEVGAEKFVYTGISHGAGTGWKLMREHPERLAAFAGVVCGPKLCGHKTSFSWRERDVARGATDEGWKERCEENKRNQLGQIRPYTSDYWKEEIRKFAEDDYNTQMSLDPHERNMTFGKSKKATAPDTEETLIEWMKTVTTPCIIFGGMQDPIVIPEAMFRTVRYIPNCKMVMYQDADHGVSIAYGDDVADEIDMFLRSRKVFEY